VILNEAIKAYKSDEDRKLNENRYLVRLQCFYSIAPWSKKSLRPEDIFEIEGEQETRKLSTVTITKRGGQSKTDDPQNDSSKHGAEEEVI
jgi:hypothetical protein